MKHVLVHSKICIVAIRERNKKATCFNDKIKKKFTTHGNRGNGPALPGTLENENLRYIL